MNRFIVQKRTYKDDHTDSELFVPGITKDMFVLEDVGRPPGIKIYGETCIPEGMYEVSVSMSTRFGKELMLLSNTPDMAVEKAGVRFTGVRPHGGNDVDDTHGCPLCAYNSDRSGKVWGRATDDIIKLVKQWLADGDEVYWVVTS
jgi:hypothetical protein